LYWYAVDSQCAYYGDNKLDLVDVENFRHLGAGYSTDGHVVFWLHFLIEGADAKTFYVPSGMSYGVDRTGCWNPNPKPCLNKHH